MRVSGKVFKYGDNVDTDVIIPARHLTSADPEVLKQHCMEDIDASFVDNVKAGDQGQRDISCYCIGFCAHILP